MASGEREREGRGKGGIHVFQAPQKKRGKGKRAGERVGDEEVAEEGNKGEVGGCGDSCKCATL